MCLSIGSLPDGARAGTQHQDFTGTMYSLEHASGEARLRPVELAHDVRRAPIVGHGVMEGLRVVPPARKSISRVHRNSLQSISRRRRGRADRIERRETPPPRRRAGVASTACRVTDDAATAATDGASRRPKTRQHRQCDAGSPPIAPRRRGSRAGAVLGTSPVAVGPRPRRGPNGLKIEEKTSLDLLSWTRRVDGVEAGVQRRVATI